MTIEARRKHMHGCTEAAASLVFYTDIGLDQFGEVGQVLSELGSTERIHDVSTIKANPSFAIRWTCLSLIAIWQMVTDEGNRVQGLAGSAVSGIARFQLGYGGRDAEALDGAQRIDKYLETAWVHVEDIGRTFWPWHESRTKREIRGILGGCEFQILELERMENEAMGMDDVDRQIALLQDAMDDVTHKLTRRLPGVSINELRLSEPISIKEAFDFPFLGSTPITPSFIFPGQQLQGLLSLGRGLRDILKNRDPWNHVETVKSLESIGGIPIPLRRLKNLMTRQLWRLQDLRDGGGLGFMIELFFLSLRQLSSTSSSSELKVDIYTDTFNVITSRWEKSRYSSGTKRILLNLLCDLIIKGRGIFSDFSYPGYIVEMLLELVGNMVESDEHDDALEELWNVNSRDCMDRSLRSKALQKFNFGSYSAQSRLVRYPQYHTFPSCDSLVAHSFRSAP